MADERIPQRGGLTKLLFDTLKAALADHDPAYGVGDGIAPADKGWPGGQPGVGEFRPYTVLKSLTSQTQRQRESIASSQPDAWLLPYQLTGWGSLREEADYVQDVAVNVIAAINAAAFRAAETSPVPSFGIQQIVVGPLGPTERTDQTNPPMWSRTDSLTVWLARLRQR